MENQKTYYSTSFYNKRISIIKEKEKMLQNRANIWIVVRLTFFVLTGCMFYFLFPYKWWSGLSLLGMVILFLFFVRKSIENKEKLQFIRTLLQLNKDEIKASFGDFSSFSGGKQYIDPHHPFSYDMDLFGKRSFFQFFNRTVTAKGEQRLATRLLIGASQRNDRIEAIDELATKPEWMQSYLAYGKMFEKKATTSTLMEVINAEYDLPKWVYVARFLFPVLAFIILSLFYVDIITGLQFIVGCGIILAPIRFFKTTNRIHKKLATIASRVSAMQLQFDSLEKETFSSSYLKKCYQQLFGEGKNGKQGLLELSKLIKEAEYRNNIIVAVILNYFFAWDFRLLIKLERWKNSYAKEAVDWEEVVYELEVLISGAIYRYNFPSNTVAPKLGEDEKIAIQEVGHPLIPFEELVANDFELNKDQQFVIVTGPNMAGKSTFLRSIGINLMLARAGFHAFARQFDFPDRVLYSSMRTSDDLKEGTSYFHAELLRLRFIVDAIESGKKVFIILDEILKGTNSKDKAEGSAKFLQKLILLKAKGIIATHDLSLTDLAKTCPTILNQYFDTLMEDNEISFDYEIKAGVAQNMNASFLLKKMKLIN